MVAAKQQGGVSSWMNAAPSKIIDLEEKSPSFNKSVNDIVLGFGERALSAAGAAVISAIIVNPLDVAKTRLQAQAAEVPQKGLCCTASFDTNTMLPDLRNYPSRNVLGTERACRPECDKYKGTLDVFYKVVRQDLMIQWIKRNAHDTRIYVVHQFGYVHGSLTFTIDK